MVMTAVAGEHCEQLQRAQTFIRGLIHLHYGKVADQCADLVLRENSNRRERHASSKVLGKLQVMREECGKYSARVVAQHDDLRDAEALRACMELWLNDLENNIRNHVAGAMYIPATEASTLSANELDEEEAIIQSSLIRLFTDMRKASIAWLAGQEDVSR